MKKTIPLIIALLLFISISPAFAELKTFIKEYTYQASEYDSKVSCRALALEQVKRLLLEELGTYLESNTEVKNYHLTKDQITIYTAGIVQTYVIKEKWDGERYWMQAKIDANSGEVIKSIENLRKDRQKTKELEDVRKKVDELMKENENLRQELRKGYGRSREEKQKEYDNNLKKLNEIECFQSGYSLWLSGNYNEAIISFNMAIELNPKYSRSYNYRGNAYGSLKDYQHALEDYNRAIQLDPKDAFPYNNRGILFLILKEYGKALKDLDKAIELNPKFVIAYCNRGITYGSIGNQKQALKDFNKAIELNPEYAPAYIDRGDAYSLLGNLEQAISQYDKGIELDPQNANAYANRGSAYYKYGKYQEAVDDWKIAAKLGHKKSQEYLKLRGIEYESLTTRQGSLNWGYYGMIVHKITTKIVESMALPEMSGVVIMDVKRGSPAEKVGINPGDIILQVNKVEIISVEDYSSEMSKRISKNKVLLLIKRGKSKFYVRLEND